MRARNHALDGLRGLAALGVLTLHVWMFTVQGAHDRARARQPAHGRAAPRRGAVLRALGLPARRAVGGQRPGRAPGAAPGALRGQARGAHRPRLLGRDARLLLAAERDRARLRGQRGPAAALRRLRAELRRRGRGQARPADVVAGGRGELLRGPPARRVAARARGAARADGAGLRRPGRRSAWRGARRARAGLARDRDVHAADLPARLRVRHGRRRARPSPRAVARGCGGRCSSRAPRSWPPTRGGTTRAPA